MFVFIFLVVLITVSWGFVAGLWLHKHTSPRCTFWGALCMDVVASVGATLAIMSAYGDF